MRDRHIQKNEAGTATMSEIRTGVLEQQEYETLKLLDS